MSWKKRQVSNCIIHNLKTANKSCLKSKSCLCCHEEYFGYSEEKKSEEKFLSAPLTYEVKKKERKKFCC